MCLDEPLPHHQSALDRSFDSPPTHPPIADRIAVLERMEPEPSV